VSTALKLNELLFWQRQNTNFTTHKERALLAFEHTCSQVLGFQVSTGFSDSATALLLPRGKEICKLCYEIFSARLLGSTPYFAAKPDAWGPPEIPAAYQLSPK